MKTIYISQPMRGLSPLKIREVREDAISRAAKALNVHALQILTTKFSDALYSTDPLYLLGECVKTLSQADVVVFCPGWSKARGCRIEHQCCLDYGIDIIELSPQDQVDEQ